MFALEKLSLLGFLVFMQTSLWLSAQSSASRHSKRAPEWPCSDYEMLIANTDQCVARCPMHCDATSGQCREIDVCPCEGYYRQRHESDAEGGGCSLECAINCLPGCIEAGGYCAGSEICICVDKDLYFDPISRLCLPKEEKKHRDRCRGRCQYGRCTSNGRCVCASGFVQRTAANSSGALTLLSLVRGGQYCVPHCERNCGPWGFCHLPNMCACRRKHHHYAADGRCYKDGDAGDGGF